MIMTVVVQVSDLYGEFCKYFAILPLDFEDLQPRMFTLNAENSEEEIRLFTTNDEITLEYEDSVILTFTPEIPGLIVGLENEGVFIRDTAIVNIIDNDRKDQSVLVIAFTYLSHFYSSSD